MKDKKKTKTIPRQVRWDKLDNTAHLFPSIAGESMTNVYRISVTLKEEVQVEFLQQALDMILPKFDGFNLRMRTGVFWYYFEENGKKAPKVTEEAMFPCRFIRQNKNRNYLFRVTYYKSRINLEVFHVLTDGMGGINFLRELTYQYLRLVHPELAEKEGNKLSGDTSLSREDSFVRNYRSSKPSGFNKEKAYLIKEDKLPAGEFGVMHGRMPVSQLKKVAHGYHASLNEYFVAVFVWSVYKELLHGMPGGKPIRIAVPVNLRPYFDSDTTKNFFVMVSAEFRPQKESYTFEEVLACIQSSLHSQINKEHLEDLFSYSVSNQRNLLMRPVPLFLKNIAMRIVYEKSAVANTTTITNIGNIKIKDIYQPYIEGFSAFIAMSKGQYLKGTICSYQDTLVFTFSSIFSEALVPGNLLEVNPVVVSQFVGLRIVVRVDAVEQRLHLVLLLGAIHRNDVLTMPRYAFRSVRTYEVSRLQKHVEYLLLAHILRLGVVVAHCYGERHLRLVEYLYYSLPTLFRRIRSDDVASDDSDVGLLLTQHGEDGVACGVASGRCRVPMDVGELHNLELAVVVETELVLCKCGSCCQQEEQSN